MTMQSDTGTARPDATPAGAPAAPGARGVRRSPGDRDPSGALVLAWLPAGLALVAEAAWLAVVGGLLQAIVLHPPAPGIPELVAAGVAGLVAARRLGPRLGDRWPGVAVALATLCGVAGWLLSPEVRSILAGQGFGGVGSALAANPGGWLLWPAFVRGMAYARVPVEPQRVAVMIGIGVVAIALCAMVGGMIGEPTRTLFHDAVRADAVLFLAAAIPALALARLASQASSALDWRRNPGWLGLVAVLLGLTIVAALVAAAFTGGVIATAVSVLFVPLLLVGFVVGFDRRSLRILALSLLAAGAIGVFLGLFDDLGRQGGAAGNVVPSTPQEPTAQAGLAIGALVVILALAVITVAVLARLWLRRPSAELLADDEVREIARDGEVDRVAGPARRRFGRRRQPVDAVTAYRLLLEEIEARPLVARADGETPAGHARRLRQAGVGSIQLDLLAADYGLARFKGAALSPAEHRRAIARAEQLRRTLLAVSRSSAATATGTAHAGAGVAGATAPGGPTVRGTSRNGAPGADLPDIEQPGVAATLLNRIRRGH